MLMEGTITVKRLARCKDSNRHAVMGCTNPTGVTSQKHKQVEI